MRVNKLAACVLGATMFWQSSALAFASDTEVPVLTLDHAIEQAINTSITLKIHDIDTELAKESAEMATLVGGYYSSMDEKVNVEYKRKQEDLYESQITLQIMGLFDTIILSQEEVELQKMNIAINEKEIKKAEIEASKGLISALDVQTLKLQNEQLHKDLGKLEQNIDLNYDKLCDLVGVSNKQYVLDKGDVAYEPYRDVISIDGFASDKAEEHIQLWKASEDLRVALETPIMGNDYMTIVGGKANRKIKEHQVDLTEQDLEQLMKQKYMDIKQLEVNYEMQKKNLELQEKQLQINEIYVEKGMMSSLAYEQSILAYEKALLSLMQLESQHARYAYELDNPYVIAAY